MKFGPVPISQAQGCILAHSTWASDTVNGTGRPYKIAKGTVLEASHISDLHAHSQREVIVARLEPGDLHENEAAARIAEALPGGGLEVTQASTGRANLRAETAGIVELDAEAIHALNRINPGITVATVPKWGRLDAHGLAVTVKIIPFAVPQADVERACDIARHAVKLVPPTVTTASLIETQVSGAKLTDKGRDATQARLDRFSVRLSDRCVVAHTTEDIATSLMEMQGELLLILTGSATSDADDVAPSALRAAGGVVEHFGMPVDPGNLLFIGRLGDRPVIGLPGCARSPALNGADWVLERLICGVPVGPDDIMAMGVGGLLKEIPVRGKLRESRRN